MKKSIMLLLVLVLSVGCISLHAKEKKAVRAKEVVSVTGREKIVQENIVLAKRRDQYLKAMQAIEIKMLNNNAVIQYIDEQEKLKEIENKK